MKLVKENIIFLQAVATLSRKQVKEILKNASKDQMLVIAEVAKNILARTLKLAEPYKSGLKKYRKTIRDIADDTTTHKDRLALVVKKAVVVSRLINAVLSTLVVLAK